MACARPDRPAIPAATVRATAPARAIMLGTWGAWETSAGFAPLKQTESCGGATSVEVGRLAAARGEVAGGALFSSMRMSRGLLSGGLCDVENMRQKPGNYPEIAGTRTALATASELPGVGRP